MNIEIYGTPTCGYCKQSVKVCEVNNIEYTYHNLHDNLELKTRLDERIGSVITTVPQIFVNGAHLPGGYTAMCDLISENS